MNTRTTAAAGLAVTAGAAALMATTASYDLGAAAAVGTAAGASVALVPGESGPRKIAGFVIGMAVAAGGYLLRAGMLPDSNLGTLIGISVTFLAITLIAVISRGRAPLWAAFAGAATMAGAYEMLHILDFAGLLANLPIAAAGVLLASAVGFTAASLFAPAAQAKAVEPARPAHVAAEAADAAATEAADDVHTSASAVADDREPVLV